MIDDLHARRPVDGNAASVFKGGAAFVPNKKIQTADSPYPIQTVNVPSDTTNLTGRRFGRMVVVGLSPFNKKSGATWVVRCACGTYTRRTAKAIKNPKNDQDACEECRHLMYLRRHDLYRQGVQS